jgi:hypothetical protein
MSKSKSNGNTPDVYDENVVVVNKTTELPFAYIPYRRVDEARAAAAWDNRLDPNKTLYVYEQEYGGKIVAYPIHMTDPNKEKEVVNG